MSVEFHLLTPTIAELGKVAAERGQKNNQLLEHLLRVMEKNSTNWDGIETFTNRVIQLELADLKRYRSAIPVHATEPIRDGVNPPEQCPEYATMIAVDGSQIIPSRHMPYSYYLLNVGGIVYHHGQDKSPTTYSKPVLHFEGDGTVNKPEQMDASRIAAERDLLEIGTLAHLTHQHQYDHAPIISIMDQRLLYIPMNIKNQEESNRLIGQWIRSMQIIQQLQGILLGYIERPETSGVVTMLNTLQMDESIEAKEKLSERPPVTDTQLFRRILKPGQRSCVFKAVNESNYYKLYQEAGQEICFFYYQPPGIGDISRVDIPLWAGQEPHVIEQIHSLLNAQCRMLNSYPYILTRADEIAVVQSADREALDSLIQIEMRKHGFKGAMTGKQAGKVMTRGGKRRHSIGRR